MSSGSSAGNSLGEAVRKGVGKFHGAGEAIRGNINAAVDSASGDRQAVARDEAIANHGADEMQRGYHHPAGTTTADPMSQSTTYGTQPSTTGPAATQSELAFRRTQTDGPSTNYGPHETNVGNKLDPTVDSDLDHRGPGRHYPEGPGTVTQVPDHASGTTYKCNQCGCTSFGLYNNSTGDRVSSPHDLNQGSRYPHSPEQPSTYDRDVAPYKSQESSNYGPHRTNIGNKLDPRYDSDLDHRGPGDHGDRPAGVCTEPGEHGEHGEYPHPPDWNKPPGFRHPYKEHDRRHPDVAHHTPGEHPEPSHGVRYDDQHASDPNQRPVWTNPLLNRLDPRVDSETGMRKY